MSRIKKLELDNWDKELREILEKDYDFFCGIKAVKNEITFEELQNDLPKYNLLDVRENWEREQHHINGQHIPLGELSNRFKELHIDKPLVVYCKSGIRSKKAITFLEEQFKNIVFLNLKNGLN